MGVVIDDLEAATAFFLDPGHEREGGGPIGGEWMDKVVGLDDVRGDLVIVKTVEGGGKLELTKFRKPADEKGACPAPANRLGIRHIAFVVHDLDTIVNGLRAKGRDLSVVGGTRCGFRPLSDGGLR